MSEMLQENWLTPVLSSLEHLQFLEVCTCLPFKALAGKNSQSTSKVWFVLGSFGWEWVVLKQAGGILVPSKIEIAGTLQVKGQANEEDLKKVEEIGRELAQKMKV